MSIDLENSSDATSDSSDNHSPELNIAVMIEGEGDVQTFIDRRSIADRAEGSAVSQFGEAALTDIPELSDIEFDDVIEQQVSPNPEDDLGDDSFYEDTESDLQDSADSIDSIDLLGFAQFTDQIVDQQIADQQIADSESASAEGGPVHLTPTDPFPESLEDEDKAQSGKQVGALDNQQPMPIDIKLDGEADQDDALIGDDFQDPRYVARSRFLFQDNPLVRAVAVGSSLLFLVVLGLAFWSVISPDDNGTVANLEEEDEEVVSVEDLERLSAEELASTKANLALSGQNAGVINLLKDKDNDVEDVSEEDDEEEEVVVVPPPSAPVAPLVSPAPVAIAPPPSPPPAPTIAPVPPPIPYGSDLSPVEQWQLASTLGAFGNPSPTFQTVPAPTPFTPSQPSTPSLFNPSSYNPPVPAITSAPSAPSPSAPASSGIQSISQLRNSSSTPGLRSTPISPVLVGTSAAAHLDTDIILSSDGTTNLNTNDPLAPKYLITLDAAIFDANGEVAIPAGVKIIGMVSNFSPNNGVVQLVANAVLSDGIEYTLPEGSMLIQAEDGGFLSASERRDGGLGRVLLPALLDGVAAAGQALNEDSSTIINNGSSSISSTESVSDIPAAAVSGAATSLSDSITRQVEQSNQRAAQRDDVWELEQGESVRIVVNSTFQM